MSRVVIAFLVLISGLVASASPAQALPGGIDGCFFRDLNGSSTMGDEVNSGASGETAFIEPITVRLVDLATNAVVVTTTDPVTGCFEFPGLVDGTNYRVRAIFPPEYYSSPTGGDTDFVPGPPPVVAGDPFVANYNFTYNAGDDLSISGGVSGLPELSLGYFVTPSGDTMIETGTGPFDTEGTCPTLTPGDDCGTYDDVVRTNDTTTIGYTITADNIPDGNVNPLNDVVLEQTITPNPGAVVSVPNLHPSCLTSGVSPVSSIVTDPVTGIITVTCNLGPKDNGTTIVPTYIVTGGESENGSSWTVEARVYSGTDRAQTLDDSSTLPPEEVFVSSAPKFDITKGNDSSNPFNRVIYYQATEQVNPATGVTEYGVRYRWDISVLYDGGTKGQAAIDGPITFSDVIPAQFSGWDLIACYNTPYGNGGLPHDATPATDWGARGTWSCAEDYANNEIDITVTNVDTDGDPTPTEGSNGTSLAAGPYVAFAGSVLIWYPLSDFYRSIDPSWDYGDPPITGSYPLSNEITDFDPSDVTGQSNYGDGTEPTENNDRALNVPIYERGGFSKHLGSYEWADARIPDGSLTGGASVWPCGASSIPAGSLMAGQTQACSQGDAPVQPGEKAHFWLWMRNDGTFPWDAETYGLCDAFDNSTMSLTTWTGGETVYIRDGITGGTAGSEYIVEYATAGFNDNVGGNSWANQVSAVQTCTAPNNDWSTDPYSFDPDPTTSLEKIGMIRLRIDETVVPEILPSQWAQISFPVEIRDTYNGGPNDGQPIPVGTILANNANRKYGSVDYSTTHMDALTYANSPWGDRLLLNRHQVRIDKTTSIDPMSATDDDLYNVEGSDNVVWWLQPGITAVTNTTVTNVQIVDTLPAGISYDSFCQASQAYPDANVALTSATVNPDGTTTVIFDLGDRPTNVAIGPIPLCTKVDNFLEPGTDLINNVEITSDGDVSPEDSRTADRTVSVVASGELALVKTVDANLELQMDTQTYSIGWRNLSSDFDFSPPDVIDVWPYNGDAVNPLNQRTEFDSNFSGSYELTNWMAQPTTIMADGSTQPTGGTWYYSADNPNTIPYDADHPDNDFTTGTVTWCTQAELTTGTAPCDFTFSDSTAVRFVQSDILLSDTTVTVDYTFQAGTVADINQPADRYVNRFAARTDSVSDLIRSNEVLVQVLSMNLGDLVFLDADVDGKYTAGTDVPIAGTVVELWIDDGTGTMVFVDSTTTDANGRYVFIDLFQGTYEVRIPDSELNGGTLDTWTQTILPQPADNDDNEDIDQQAYDSGLGYTTSGTVVLSANTVLDPPLGQEPVGENIFNLGNPYTYDNLTNMSIDLGFRGDPEVQVVKEVCDTAMGSCDLTTDALDPSDGWVETVVIPFTDTALWRITIINTGFEVLTNVTIEDDFVDSCDRLVGNIPDIAVGDSYSYTCSQANVVEDILNTAAVDAEGIGSGIPVEDEDTAAVETPPTDPDIEVVKYVNGDDAQNAPGVYINPGDPVTFTYEVTTGSGSVPLSDVVVSDNNGTSLDTTDDFTATYVSGDTDGDDILDLDETWLYEATGFNAVVGQYTNWASASGQPVAPDTDPVSDLDPAHYFGVDGGLKLTKFVQGDDANSAPGVLVDPGSPVTFTYEVENTGNVQLNITSFVDNAGTSADATDDWNPTYVTGDIDGDLQLDINETWTYTWTGEVAVTGAYTNLASIIGTDPLNTEFPDSDPANYYGADPAFELEKSTNTIDADSDPVSVADNSTVVWEYVLDNTGNAPISNPRVQDDAGTPADPTDDFYAAYVSGDTNNDGILDVDETWIFRATGTATEASYQNEATATGIGPPTVDENGDPVSGEQLEDTDPSGYVVADPAIGITKFTNDTDNAAATGVYVLVGDPVTWTYEVTNEGDVPLSNVNVVDDNGTPADPADDVTLTYASGYVSGDIDGNGILGLRETWIFELTGTATADQYNNNAETFGTPPPVTNTDGTETTPEPVTDEDPDYYYGLAPAIEIIKVTNTVDSDTQRGILVNPGDPITWTYTVTNPGNIALSNVTVTDDSGTPADPADDLVMTLSSGYVTGDANANGLLDVDETWIFEANGTAVAGAYTNVAVVVGTPPDTTNPDGTTTTPDPVTDSNPDNYYGSSPEITLTKTTNTEDNNTQPGVTLYPGDPITWTYTVDNSGDVDLSDVSVVDDSGTPADPADDVTLTYASGYVSGDIDGDEILDQDETWIFEATGVAVEGQYTNGAAAEGTPPPVIDEDGNPVEQDPVTDSDPDNYLGGTPEIVIVKSTNAVDNTAAPGVYLNLGDPVTWTYSVSNPGNVPLSDVTVVDDNGTPADDTDDVTLTYASGYVSGDANADGILDVGETWLFEATGTAAADQYGNNAVTSGTPPPTTNPDGTTTAQDPVTDEDPDFYFGIDPAIQVVKVTNSVNSDAQPGIFLNEGDPITWTYTVTNPGNIALSDVTLTDDAGTPFDPADDIVMTLSSGYVSGDANADGLLDVDETWIFEATGTAESGVYRNDAVVEGTPPDVTNPDGTTTPSNPVTDSNPDHYYGTGPSIDLVKYTNTEDNNTQPGIVLSPGDPITWTYVVDNNGDVPLTDVNVVDDNGTPTDPTDDVTLTYTSGYVSGDGDGDEILDLGETWTFEATGVATEGPYTNSAVAGGTPPSTVDQDGNPVPQDPVTDEDPDNYLGATPEIGIVKTTNAADNNAAPGVYLNPGDPVIWTYTVTNPGNVPLSDVAVVDDNGTPTDATDDVALTFTSGYVSGDANADGVLDLDETWIFETTGTAAASQYGNNAETSGTPPPTTNPDGSTTPQDPVTDEDPDFYYGLDPAIEVVKVTNAVDSDVEPGILLNPGDPITWTYTVTNPGNIALSDVSVTDDAGTPAITADDIVLTLLSGYLSGDANADGLLDIDETWIFEATGTAESGPYRNDAVVEGTPPDTTNPDGTTTPSDPVTDSNPDHYYGTGPSIDLVKYTNTEDNNIQPGIVLSPGDPITWTYVVDNTGDVPLSDVNVVDDNGTPADDSDDVTLMYTSGYVSGDTNGDEILDVDETWTFEATGVAIEGPYTNSGVAGGTPPPSIDEDGNPVPQEPVTDEDPDNYFGAIPQIAIIKTTNTQDNNTPTGVNLNPGDPVTWTYTVTNPGSVPLSDVTVSDDSGTPVDPADDVTLTYANGYLAGDTNGDQILDLDETWIFEASGIVIPGPYTNNGVAEGTPPPVIDEQGNPVPQEPVTAEDPDNYLGAEPGLALVKTTNGTDNPDGTGPFVRVGDTVTWTYTVTNTGNVPLSDVSVADDAGTPSDATDDIVGTYLSGDANNDGLLDLDEVWTFEATGVAVEGQYVNNGAAEGTPPPAITTDGSETPLPPTTDEDDDRYWGAEPGIDIVKAVNGEDANEAPGLYVADGELVSWTYTVTNTGNTPLVSINVGDNMDVQVTCPATTLDVGEQMVCEGAAEPATLGQYTNIGSVEATPAAPCDCPEGFEPIVDPETGEPTKPVLAEDPANHFGTGPGVDIEKQVCNLEAIADCDIENDDHWVEVTTVGNGEDAMWRIAVTNIGNIELVDLVVTDDNAPACNQTLAALASGDTWSYTCVLEDITDPTINTAAVEAPTSGGVFPPVRDEDTAEVVAPAELELIKTVNTIEALVGDRVTYTLTISNTGLTDAVDVEVIDELPENLTSIDVSTSSGVSYDIAGHTLTWTSASLPVGESVSVDYSAVVESSGSIVNNAAIISDHGESDLSDNTDTSAITSVAKPEPPPLAFTGSNSWTFVAVAVSMILVGGLFVSRTRRRKTQTLA